MKSGSNFEQASYSAFDPDAPFGWFGNAAQNLQERAFSCAISPDNPDDLASLDLKRNVSQSPKLLLGHAPGKIFIAWIPVWEVRRSVSRFYCAG
jgi:hypothetical protein